MLSYRACLRPPYSNRTFARPPRPLSHSLKKPANAPQTPFFLFRWRKYYVFVHFWAKLRTNGRKLWFRLSWETRKVVFRLRKTRNVQKNARLVMDPWLSLSVFWELKEYVRDCYGNFDWGWSPSSEKEREIGGSGEVLLWRAWIHQVFCYCNPLSVVDW